MSSSGTLPPVVAGTPTPDLPDGLTPDLLRRMYAAMVMIRVFDERSLKLQRAGRIGFCVTSQGEEAAQIGTAAALQPEDWIFPSYRQYGVALYRGAPMQTMLDQLFGNADDICVGRQMPVHYSLRDQRFVSISSVIGTQIIQGVGCAMAAKSRGDQVISLTYFGDGATSANDFHSAMTFAGVMKAPVILACVNNQFAISLPVEKQTAVKELYLKAEGYGMPGVRVDGSDVIAVYQATRKAAELARQGGGPTFLELFTYRAGPHSSSDDPSRYRDQAEKDAWMERRDPIARMRSYLTQLALWTDADETALWDSSQEQFTEAMKAAEAKPQPDWSTLFDDVYATLPPSLVEQRDTLLAHERHLNLKHAGEFPL
jgi:pyruvate dehydrogenase E1 component alpha subunit